jgi:hypothetical protein
MKKFKDKLGKGTSSHVSRSKRIYDTAVLYIQMVFKYLHVHHQINVTTELYNYWLL